MENVGQIRFRKTWMNMYTDKPKTPSVKLLPQETLHSRRGERRCHVELALGMKGPIWSVSLVKLIRMLTLLTFN